LNITVLQNYNIVGDGSPQALIPILTSKAEPELPLTLKNKKNSNYVNVYPFIWNNFSDNGYVTQYGEDTPYIGTFTYRMKGFNKQPTNLYLRPYYLRAWKKHFRSHSFCYAGKPRHQIMLDWTREFFKTYSDVPRYSFNFYTEISHDDFNLVQIADQDIVDFFSALDQSDVFNNTIGILMSDHGARFSTMRSTLQGKYEERLPFFSFILPKGFESRFPNAYHNLKENAQTRLLTPFDIYSTLMTVLTKFNKGKDTEKFTDYGSKLPRSLSIFEYIPLNRTCSDADIDNHWCTCLHWITLSENDELALKAGESLLTFINDMNSNTTDQCNRLTVKQITRAQKIEPEKDLLHFKKSADANGFVPDLSDKTFDKIENELYQIQLIASPSDAMYEATIHYNVAKKQFSLKESEISRINKYGDQDHCIHDSYPNLRKYCHCKVEKN